GLRSSASPRNERKRIVTCLILAWKAITRNVRGRLPASGGAASLVLVREDPRIPRLLLPGTQAAAQFRQDSVVSWILGDVAQLVGVLRQVVQLLLGAVQEAVHAPLAKHLVAALQQALPAARI